MILKCPSLALIYNTGSMEKFFDRLVKYISIEKYCGVPPKKLE
jgi:hypothetical protein